MDVAISLPLSPVDLKKLLPGVVCFPALFVQFTESQRLNSNSTGILQLVLGGIRRFLGPVPDPFNGSLHAGCNRAGNMPPGLR